VTPPPDIPEKEIRKRCAGLLAAAAEEARRLGHNYIGTEHLFIASTKIEDGATALLLRRAGLNPRTVRNEIRREIGTGEGSVDAILPLTPRAEMVLSLAIFMADREESEEIEESHVLLALLQEGEGVPIRKLIEMGFHVNLWLQRLLNEAYEKDLASPDESDLFQLSDLDEFIADDPFMQSSSEMDVRPNGRIPTPLLDKYGRDLTAQAADGKIGPAIAREREIRAVARTLARSKKNNPLLLGDAGVGKTAVVEGLAYAIQNGTAPTSLLNRRVVQIEIGTLVAGTSLRGQF
jgi:ATP-dependent Clp protease ATP-binding subunit ClpC